MPYLQTSTFATSHVGNSCRCWPGIKWGAQSCFKNQDSKQHLHLQLPPPVATGEHLTPAAAGQESKEQISLPESIFQGSTCDHKFPTPAATSQESKQVHNPASKSGFRANLHLAPFSARTAFNPCRRWPGVDREKDL